MRSQALEIMSPAAAPVPAALPLRSCWSRQQLLRRTEDWTRPLPERARRELLKTCRAIDGAALFLEPWPHAALASPGLREFGWEVGRELYDGSGVVHVTGLARRTWVPEHWQRWAYLLLGLELGAPVGTYRGLLGLDDSAGTSVPPAQAWAEASFHADGDGLGGTPDVVGFLCVRPGRTPYRVQLASAIWAHEMMKAYRPDLLRELYGPFLWEGAAPAAGADILRTCSAIFTPGEGGRGLQFRYARHAIEAGHARAGAPLTPGQQAALDRLDQLLMDTESCVDVEMEAGDMLFVHNRRIAHRCSEPADPAATDAGDTPRIVRLWLVGS